MYKTYLFDWGDTLMVDFPGVPGKMCDWDRVEPVPGARSVLASLAKRATVYVATSAAESKPEEIERAFGRVDLARFITGYFCRHNTGFVKPDLRFYQSILDELNIEPGTALMVGDSLENDISPCVSLGLPAVWFNPDRRPAPSDGSFREIHLLLELIAK